MDCLPLLAKVHFDPFHHMSTTVALLFDCGLLLNSGIVTVVQSACILRLDQLLIAGEDNTI